MHSSNSVKSSFYRPIFINSFMQKELQLKDATRNGEWVTEKITFSNREEAIAFIEKFISSNKEKPLAAYLTLSTNEPITLFGYRGVSTIRAPEFLVHVSDNEYERGFSLGFAKDICMVGSRISKRTPLSWFDEKLMGEILGNSNDLAKFSDSKFEGLITIFSAINNKGITPLPLPAQSLNLRQTEAGSLSASTKDYEEQLKAILLLMKLEGENLPSKDAVKNVLRYIRTDMFVSACHEYGFKIEKDIASSFLTKEEYARLPLNAFIIKWEGITNDPRRMVDELKGDIYLIGTVVRSSERVYGLKVESERLQTKPISELETDLGTAKTDERPVLLLRLGRNLEKLEKEFKRKGLSEELSEKLDKLEETAKQLGVSVQPAGSLEEIKKKTIEVGAELCEIHVKRNIVKYDISVAEDFERIRSTESNKQSEVVKDDELRLAELQKSIDLDKAGMESTKRKCSNLKETLKIMQEMVGPNESTKP